MSSKASCFLNVWRSSGISSSTRPNGAQMKYSIALNMFASVTATRRNAKTLIGQWLGVLHFVQWMERGALGDCDHQQCGRKENGYQRHRCIWSGRKPEIRQNLLKIVPCPFAASLEDGTIGGHHGGHIIRFLLTENGVGYGIKMSFDAGHNTHSKVIHLLSDCFAGNRWRPVMTLFYTPNSANLIMPFRTQKPLPSTTTLPLVA